VFRVFPGARQGALPEEDLPNPLCVRVCFLFPLFGKTGSASLANFFSSSWDRTDTFGRSTCFLGSSKVEESSSSPKPSLPGSATLFPRGAGRSFFPGGWPALCCCRVGPLLLLFLLGQVLSFFLAPLAAPQCRISAFSAVPVLPFPDRFSSRSFPGRFFPRLSRCKGPPSPRSAGSFFFFRLAADCQTEPAPL